jgi:tetratricopeptide (TPR) repeat protein
VPLRYLAATVVVVCLGVIGGVGWFIVYPQLAYGRHARHAQQALEARDFSRARVHLERCLEQRPNSGETHFLLARTCRRAGDFDAARTHLKEAGRVGWPAALIDLEGLLMQAQAGAVGPVEPTLRRFLGSRPDQQQAILEALTVGCLQSNYLDRAYHWATTWADRYPEDWQARFWRGQVLERGLRYDLAVQDFEQALAGRPDHAETHVRLADVLFWRGRYAEALVHFEAYLQTDPDHPAALLGLARCQRALNPPEVARATLARLLARHPEHAGGCLLRGQLELDADNPDEALVWLRRAVASAPHDMEANQALATVLRRLMREEEAKLYERKKQQIEEDLRQMERLTKEILTNPDNVSLRYEAGTTLLRLGQEQQALRWLFSALLLDRHHEPTTKAVAECLQKLGDPKLLEYYRRIVEGPP